MTSDARLRELALAAYPKRCSGYTRCCDQFYEAVCVREIIEAVPALLDAKAATEKERDALQAWVKNAEKFGYVHPDTELKERAETAERELARAREALCNISQRANESGTGEMGLIDTIHAMHGMARAALGQAHLRESRN